MEGFRRSLGREGWFPLGVPYDYAIEVRNDGPVRRCVGTLLAGVSGASLAPYLPNRVHYASIAYYQTRQDLVELEVQTRRGVGLQVYTSLGEI